MSLDTDANLQAFYKFNNSGSVGLDSSPAAGGNGLNSMTAAGTGAVTAVSDTVRGSVLQTTVTNGSNVSYLELASRFGSASNNVTLAGWVKVTVGGDNNTFHILNIGGGTSILKTPGDTLAGGWFQSTTPGTLQILQTGSAVSSGWHHVAMTISATAQILYVDGVNVASATFTNANNIEYPVGLTNSVTRIGIRDHPTANAVTTSTLVDDVRYYNRVLTSGEVAALAGFGATNMNAAETLTEDTTMSLTAIVISNTTTATATLTLSNTLAGSIVPVNDSSGGATSSFASGVWSATGPVAGVNTLLGRIEFLPVSNFASNFTIATSVAGDVTTITGSKAITAVAVNDAPTATGLTSSMTFVRNTPSNIPVIEVADVDAAATITATLTLSTPSAGAINVGTSGAVTSTFNAGTGVWQASGAIDNVNTLLASLVFTPATGYITSFTIGTSVTDGVATPITGTITVTSLSTSGPVICFAANTNITLANGRNCKIQDIRPGMAVYSGDIKPFTVKKVLTCKTQNVIVFEPECLGKQQIRHLIVSPHHLLWHEQSGKWKVASMISTGVHVRLQEPITLYNIQPMYNWTTMFAENVQCETCAITPLQKKQRSRFLKENSIYCVAK